MGSRMNTVVWLLIFALTVVIFMSFFMPWVSVQSKQVGMFSKLLTGKEQGEVAAISGFKIPVLANGEDARLMISIIKMFSPNIKDADKKSFAVWGIPFLAILLCAVSYFLGNNKLVNIIIGVLGIAIFFVAVYKINTTDLDKLVLNVKIAPAMWLILYSYLSIGILHIVSLFKGDKK